MRENPLAQAYRPIRRLVPPDAPLPGLLAACGEETVLLVDADLVPTALWRPDEPAHVWSPRDVALSASGQTAVLPWCSMTLEGYLARRAAEPLEGGEAVTLLVSLVRGHREAAVGDTVTGRWWLTDAGCPTFVPGDGARLSEATVAAADAVAAGADDRVLSRVVSRLPSLLEAPVQATALDGVERDLFDAYAPRPLRAATVERSAVGAIVAQPREPAAQAAPERVRERRRAPALWQRWAAALARVLPGEGTEDPRRRAATPPSGTRAPRRALAVVAVGAAAVVLVVGIGWPDGSGNADDAPSTAPRPSTSAPAIAATEAAPAAPAADRASDDPLVAARWLIAAAGGCGACGEIARSADAATAAAGLRDPALVEDYGGVAVVRGTGPDGERFVVLERQDGAWWIREVSARPAGG